MATLSKRWFAIAWDRRGPARGRRRSTKTADLSRCTDRRTARIERSDEVFARAGSWAIACRREELELDCTPAIEHAPRARERARAEDIDVYHPGLWGVRIAWNDAPGDRYVLGASDLLLCVGRPSGPRRPSSRTPAADAWARRSRRVRRSGDRRARLRAGHARVHRAGRVGGRARTRARQRNDANLRPPRSDARRTACRSGVSISSR